MRFYFHIITDFNTMRLLKLTKVQSRKLSTSLSWQMKEGDSTSITRSISREDLKAYGELVGDLNPIHFCEGDSDPIVHGTYLLGLVSGLMASKLPGPGTVLTNIDASFLKPCPCPVSLEMCVILGKVRKVTTAQFSVKNVINGDILVQGNVKCLLNKDQLNLKK